MSELQRQLAELHKARRDMCAPMDSMLREFGRVSAQAAAQFNKAFRESTAWQYKRREGIGGA